MKEVDGYFWYFCYLFSSGDGYLEVVIIWFEMMLGDMVVVVNFIDECYVYLVGQIFILLFVEREILIVVDDYVEKDFGIGCVKVILVYDFNDFVIGQCYGLFQIMVMCKNGMMNKEVGQFEGLDCFEVCKVVVVGLEELGLLVKVEDYCYSVFYFDCGKVLVELLFFIQWFVKIEFLVVCCCEVFEKYDFCFIFGCWEKVYCDWFIDICDWCIS